MLWHCGVVVLWRCGVAVILLPSTNVTVYLLTQCLVVITFISVCNQPPWPTQPSILPGSVNEDQLWLGRKR